MQPRRLFDTELAARLAGFERVGLAALTEQLLGFTPGEAPLGGRLVDPAAAGVLADLRGARRGAAHRPARRARRRAGPAGQAGVGGRGVRRAGRQRRPAAPGPRPTRGGAPPASTGSAARGPSPGSARSGTPGTRSPPAATPRPGRVLPDSAIIAAAELDPKDERTLLALPGLRRPVGAPAGPGVAGRAGRGPRAAGRRSCRSRRRWTGPPPPHRWAERDPVAAARLARCREVVIGMAEAHTLPPENLISPGLDPPAGLAAAGRGHRRRRSRDTLRGFGARAWQVGLIADGLAAALPDPAPTRRPE